MKRVILLSLLIVAFLATNSFAQTQKRYSSKGCWEIGGTIGFSSITPVANGVSGDAVTSFSLSPIGGYFIMKGVELGAQFLFNTASQQNNTETTFGFYAVPAYVFDTKTMAFPYIGGMLGYTSSSAANVTASGFSWGLLGGVKLNLVGHSLLGIGVNYRQETLSPSGATTRSGRNVLEIVTGWTIFL